MVMEFGMSDLGPVNYGPNYDATQWGRSLNEQNYMQKLIKMIVSKKVLLVLYLFKTKT